MTQKYGSTAQQQSAIRETIRQRGAELGFTFRVQGRDRIYNTFDAHRLLHWAELTGLPGQQLALKKPCCKPTSATAKAPKTGQCWCRRRHLLGSTRTAPWGSLRRRLRLGRARARTAVHPGRHTVSARRHHQSTTPDIGWPAGCCVRTRPAPNCCWRLSRALAQVPSVFLRQAPATSVNRRSVHPGLAGSVGWWCCE